MTQLWKSCLNVYYWFRQLLASGNFLCNDLLFRKWVPVREDTLKADVFQLVVTWSVWTFWCAENIPRHPQTFLLATFSLKPVMFVSSQESLHHCSQFQLNQNHFPTSLSTVCPLLCSKSGCKCLLTVIGICWVFPLRFITTKLIVKAPAQFMPTFGIPKVVQSECYKCCILSKTSRHLLMLSQGPLKRFHQTLK